MPISSVRCPVLGANVVRVTDLEGAVTRVICPGYIESTGHCRLRKDVLQGGPLSQLLERLEEQTLDRRSVECQLR